MTSELHIDLAKLASFLTEDQRSHLTVLSQVPKNLLEEYVKDYKCEVTKEQRPSKRRKLPDFENEHEGTLDVMAALEGPGDCQHLLKHSMSLFDTSKAKILNVVASLKLANFIDLDQLASRAWNVEYNKKNFPGIVIQIREPEATGIVYTTGRMIVTGARCEKDSKEAAMQCVEIIQRAGCKINGGDSYRVQNICATINLGYKIRIHEMGANKDIKNSSKVINYTPEIFAGLVCSFEAPKCTVVCFATGTLLFSGAQKENDVQVALERFRYLSYPYKY